jgi:uncharacterized protein (DUF362 family)
MNNHRKKPDLSRRNFLKWAGLSTAGLLAAGCQPKAAPAPAAEGSPTPVKEAASTATSAPTPVVVATAATSLTVAQGYQVAIAQATTYDRTLVQQKMQELVEGLGGLSDVVRPGDKVAIKINLTGGSNFQSPAGVTAPESYVTHPEVVMALGKLILDAGASQIYIVEGLYDTASYAAWGFDEVAKALNAQLIDLNFPDPSSEFMITPVGENSFIYKEFSFNPILSEVAAFFSISKMKCHYSAGVTHTMKNLIGLVPVSLYRTSPDHFWRSALHGDDYGPTRLPRVIVDLNQARPVHFSLVDGIKAAEGGEVPRGSFAPVQPGVLVAGKNPVATDAVTTAIMGFDPTAEYPASPFLHGENHLNLAAGLGLGSNRLDEIAIMGPSIADVRYEFSPSTSQGRDHRHRQPFT